MAGVLGAAMLAGALGSEGRAEPLPLGFHPNIGVSEQWPRTYATAMATDGSGTFTLVQQRGFQRNRVSTRQFTHTGLQEENFGVELPPNWSIGGAGGLHDQLGFTAIDPNGFAWFQHAQAGYGIMPGGIPLTRGWAGYSILNANGGNRAAVQEFVGNRNGTALYHAGEPIPQYLLQTAQGQFLDSVLPIAISPDGSTVVGQFFRNAELNAGQRPQLGFATATRGWTPFGVPITNDGFSLVSFASSQDGSIWFGPSLMNAPENLLRHTIFRWTEATGPEVIALPEGIENQGVVLGAATADGSIVAVQMVTYSPSHTAVTYLYQEGQGWATLESLLQRAGLDLGTWQLANVVGIEQRDGQLRIVGNAFQPGQWPYGTVAFTAVIPTPSTILPLALLLTLNRRKRPGFALRSPVS